MNSKRVIEFCIKHIGRAVVIDFVDKEDSDWQHFRIERVRENKIALSGMTNNDGDQHNGDYFWSDADEIEQICLR